MSSSIFSNFEENFKSLLEKEFLKIKEETLLKDALYFALTNGGKRLRPLIVDLVAKALNKNQNVEASLLSIEFFHTASLIADDLPCMDNDDLRREKPSLHKQFGEATALLASYGLITKAFEKIYENLETSTLKQKEKRVNLALKEVSFAAGIGGATGGQFLDLFAQKPTLKQINEIIEKKTARLFEVSFLLGWLFGGGNLKGLSMVKKLGYHFGFAFQVADDLQDMNEDEQKEKKINIALHIGKEKAEELFQKHINKFENYLEKLNIKTESFIYLVDKVKKYQREEKHAK